MWRRHSCLPCRDSSRHLFAGVTRCRTKSVPMSGDAAGTSACATSYRTDARPTTKNGEPEGSPWAISKGRKRSTLELKLQGELNVTATRSVRRNGRCGGDIGIGALDIKIRVVEHVVHLTTELNLQLLGNREALVQSDVEIPVSGSAELVAAGDIGGEWRQVGEEILGIGVVVHRRGDGQIGERVGAPRGCHAAGGAGRYRSGKGRQRAIVVGVGAVEDGVGRPAMFCLFVIAISRHIEYGEPEMRVRSRRARPPISRS